MGQRGSTWDIKKSEEKGGSKRREGIVFFVCLFCIFEFYLFFYTAGSY